MTTKSRIAPLFLFLLTIAPLACADLFGPRQAIDLTPSGREVVGRLVVERADAPNEFRLAVEVDAYGGIGTPGAFQIEIRLPDGVKVVGEAVSASGFLVAANYSDPLLKAAGAKAQSAGAGRQLVEVRVLAPSEQSAASARLFFRELRDGSGNDLLPMLRVAAPRTGRPR